MNRTETTYQHPDGTPRVITREDHDGPCEHDDCEKTEPHRHIAQTGGSGKGCYLLLWGPDKPTDTLVVVEGEKAAQALNQHLVGRGTNHRITPVSWMGGAGAESNADWSSVSNRNVILWPDNDDAGRRAMTRAAKKARRAGAHKVMVMPTAGDDGRDVSDMTFDEIRDELTMVMWENGVWSKAKSRSQPATMLSEMAGFRWDTPIWVVGGTVRNLIMNEPIRDVDLAVQGDPHPLAEALAASIGGSVVNVGTLDNIKRVALNGRFVFDIVGFEGTIEQDLVRRDFTVNALAIPLDEWPQKQHVIGVSGAQHPSDLAHCLRPVHDRIFEDDPARLLRAIRFMHECDFDTIDSRLPGMIFRHSRNLMKTAPERLMVELFKILNLPHCHEVVRETYRYGLLGQMIPELVACDGVTQPPTHHHHDVLEHQFHTLHHAEHFIAGPYMGSRNFSAYFEEEVAHGQNRGMMLKLAALLHDIGKPSTRTVAPTGGIHFYGHEVVGAQLVYDRAKKLRISNRIAKMLYNMTLHHMRPHDLVRHGVTNRAIHKFCRSVKGDVIDILWLGMADKFAHRDPSDYVKAAYLSGVDRVLEVKDKPVNSPARACSFVDGKMLMAELNLKPGVIIGRLLDILCEAEAIGEITNQYEAIERARQALETEWGPECDILKEAA